jgi:aminoglycoside phosphotransferase (APT) family kinase protein
VTGQVLAGLDGARFRHWFSAAIPEAGAGLSIELIAGGKSNLTFAVTDGDSTWVLRRPPLGHILDTAHDMSREYRVMSALATTRVPVPHTLAFCDDEGVMGAPFYVMEWVAGTPYRYAKELAALGTSRTRAISERLVDTLADLGAVDPDAIGLADFGMPDGFLGRQLGRWHRQLAASHSRDLPAAEELHALLAASVPPESSVGIVHGDFRLDNVLVDANDALVAVIDWEMATLGDPLTDLALMVVYQRLGALLGERVANAASAPGYLTETETLYRYAAVSGRELPRFGWYLGLASYKLAAIIEGIHYRHAQGATVGPGFEEVGAAVEPLLDAGMHAMKEWA